MPLPFHSTKNAPPGAQGHRLMREVRIMSMFNCDCSCKLSCTALAVIAAVVVGVLTAFLQISGVVILGVVFLWVAFGIAVVYLWVLTLAAALSRRAAGRGQDCCRPLGTVLAGVLGTIALAVVLLAVGVVATSVISAILAGILLFFFTLMLAATACYARCLADCTE